MRASLTTKSLPLGLKRRREQRIFRDCAPYREVAGKQGIVTTTACRRWLPMIGLKCFWGKGRLSVDGRALDDGPKTFRHLVHPSRLRGSLGVSQGIILVNRGDEFD